MSRVLVFVAVVLAAVVSLSAGQSISFSQVASNSAFPPREYAACAQTPASPGSTPTLYFFGGLNVTLSASSANISAAGNSYTDGYFNDAWSSSSFGSSWTQLSGGAAFPAQGWNGAVRLQSGAIVYIGGGGDSNGGENNQVWTSTTGATFTAASPASGPWQPRENAGIAGMAGTNNILVALGNTNNNQSVDDIWYSADGGATWNQTCHFTTCPFVGTVDSTRVAGQVHGPAAVGLSTGYWLLIGGYGNDPTTTSTTWVTNQVAVSNNAFVSWSTYAAPWSPRAQQRAVVDADNYVYVYGGVYNLPLSGSGTAYANVPGQVYYGYYQDLWYSTNAVAGNWQQISLSGIAGAGYPGMPYQYSSNPNSNTVGQAFFADGAIFNPCLGFGYSATGAKQLVLYTGLYAGYRQNAQAGLNVAYPGVYVGTLNLTTNATAGSSTGSGYINGTGSSSSTGSGTGAATSVTVQLPVVMALAALLLAVVQLL